jgi:hypothetical protein
MEEAGEAGSETGEAEEVEAGEDGEPERGEEERERKRGACRAWPRKGEVEFVVVVVAVVDDVLVGLR